MTAAAAGGAERAGGRRAYAVMSRRGDVLGAIRLVFFVLPITDIPGFTRVFPFTRSIRR